MKIPSTSSVISDIRKKWKPRQTSSHKGHFGKVAIVAGSEGMTGAATLTAAAALNCGAGLISLAVPRQVYPILAKVVEKEVMVKPFVSTPAGYFSYRAISQLSLFVEKKDVLAIGPGMTQAPGVKRLVRCLCKTCSKRLVIDADGLNAFQSNLNDLKKIRAEKILTPHMGEYLKLFGGDEPETLEAKVRQARKSAKQYDLTLVLKGENTVVADSKGQFFVNPSGNPGMASGGMGDVLTGAIAAFLGQHENTFNAVCWAVFLHGYAADLAAKEVGEISLKASDVISYLPKAIQKVYKQ